MVDYNKKSKCCNAPMTIEGITTRYFVCLQCGCATDPK